MDRAGCGAERRAIGVLGDTAAASATSNRLERGILSRGGLGLVEGGGSITSFFSRAMGDETLASSIAAGLSSTSMGVAAGASAEVSSGGTSSFGTGCSFSDKTGGCGVPVRCISESDFFGTGLGVAVSFVVSGFCSLSGGEDGVGNSGRGGGSFLCCGCKGETGRGLEI